MKLLVEYRVLDNLKVINEGTGPNKKLKVKGKFQKCDETNNNGRIYPRQVLESQVQAIQEKIGERSLVGALDHPPNDAIHLSQASHLITKLWVEKNGDVMGEAEILSTPSGKIVEALLSDNVKIGISSRGMGTISEGKEGKVVNEDFKLITFDLVSDPSTKGAYTEITESVKLNSEKAKNIVSKMKKEQIFLTLLNQKINERVDEGGNKANKAKKKEWEKTGNSVHSDFNTASKRNKPHGKELVYNIALNKKHNRFGKVGKKAPWKKVDEKNSIYQRLAKLIEKKSKDMDFISGKKISRKMFGQYNHDCLRKKAEVVEEGSVSSKRAGRAFKVSQKAFRNLDKKRSQDSSARFAGSDAEKKSKYGINLTNKVLAKRKFKSDQKKGVNQGFSKQFHANETYSRIGQLISNKKSKAVKESIQRIQEGKGTKDDKICIKNFLLSRLSDLHYSYPYKAEPYDPDKKPKSEESITNEKIGKLKRLLDIIEEI